MLKSVYDSKHKIKLFFESKLKNLPEFEDQHWLCGFKFLVYVTGHLNEVNKRLELDDQFRNNVYEHVSAFQMKLGLLEQQLSSNELIHFPTLLAQAEVNDLKRFSFLISDLKL